MVQYIYYAVKNHPGPGWIVRHLKWDGIFNYRTDTGKLLEKLLSELKVKIIDTLSLEGVTPEDIDVDAQLVGGDFGIDSIDVLELVLMMEKDYSVAIKDRELGAKVFASLRSLAEYIHEKSPEVSN